MKGHPHLWTKAAAGLARGLLFGFLFLGVTARAFAHEVRPAYLEITEQAGRQYEVLWKQPAAGELAVRLVPHLSSGWLEAPPADVDSSASFVIKIWRPRADAGALQGQTLYIEGLEQTITDVLVSVSLADGSRHQEILKPSRTSVTLQLGEQSALPVPAYLSLGVEHILTGVDHLIFVLGLMLLVRGRLQLLTTITAFTIAHSITLALATLGWVRVQPSLVEVFIALSIVFLAVELVRLYRGNPGLTARYPWLVAFAFGLLHGLGFAGALANIGLPRDALALSLFLFNVGVELGQLLFVALALTTLLVLRRLPTALPSWVRWVPPYAIGSFAAFWFIERLA